MGEENDAFNKDYNELLTPWSNPSSYVNGTTDISVELVSKNGNNITVKVYSTSASALALPPSKPQNLQVSVNQYDEAVLSWEANIEDDIKSGGKYKIYRAEIIGTGEPTSWDLIETIDAYNGSTPVTSWTDGSTYIYNGPKWLHYKISALDSTLKESVPSDKVKINGRIPKQSSGEQNNLINSYEIRQNHPNPFNPTTTIHYAVKEKGLVSLAVYDILGREVAELVNESKDEGSYTVNFNAGSLPSGVYIYSFRVNDFTAIKKMTLVK